MAWVPTAVAVTMAAKAPATLMLVPTLVPTLMLMLMLVPVLMPRPRPRPRVTPLLTVPLMVTARRVTTPCRVPAARRIVK